MGYLVLFLFLYPILDFKYFIEVDKPLELIAFASTKKKGVPIFIGSLIVNGTCYDEIGSCAYNLLTILSLIVTLIRRACVII